MVWSLLLGKICSLVWRVFNLLFTFPKGETIECPSILMTLFLPTMKRSCTFTYSSAFIHVIILRKFATSENGEWCWSIVVSLLMSLSLTIIEARVPPYVVSCMRRIQAKILFKYPIWCFDTLKGPVPPIQHLFIWVQGKCVQYKRTSLHL